MRNVLITGVSAAGKSTLARWLAEHGQRAVSLDGYPGLCDWVDEHGRGVTWPTDPDHEWMTRHRWVWRPQVLDGILADAANQAGGTLFACGRAVNAREMADRFDAVIGLFIDEQTMAARLGDPKRGNPFGRMGDSRQYLLDNLNADQRALAEWADAIIDARKPLEHVGEEVMAAAAIALLRMKAPSQHGTRSPQARS
ncbi:AAA family ATPase [Catellatospora citrea]|uniref:Shikimate kinase n=1 Tax=Catellatospora citrea TaxID=53366 RepID=A0A8J3KEW1_9ACTN|nr:AAA family ATPase [Catellatospora citrea]RKE10574.1 hypothetical protein C8E86_5486 [Catellatospora citrea]GIF98761.1 hypothetical protein Cci01nite_38550 [Catellatospora citrea]